MTAKNISAQLIYNGVLQVCGVSFMSSVTGDTNGRGKPALRNTSYQTEISTESFNKEGFFFFFN